MSRASRGRKLVARTAGSCVAFDRRRYTLPTNKRGLEEASMRKLLALILLICFLCVAATAQQPTRSAARTPAGAKTVMATTQQARNTRECSIPRFARSSNTALVIHAT